MGHKHVSRIPKRMNAKDRSTPNTALRPGGVSPEAIAERRVKALTLRKAGASYRDIAKQLDVGLETAWSDVQAELVALREHATQLAEEVRELELRRLDDITIQATTRMRAGDPRWANVALKTQERRAKLLGLDKPAEVDVTSGGKAFTITIGDARE